ncbi:serpin family protein [candidate division KSB1 bacterium]|nr:serpin family protein [candidate division KSB1 bacterium]
MKKLFLILLALLLAAHAQAQMSSVVAANNTFAAHLYGELAKPEGNLFFSPYSISTALAMAYAGAHGETAAEMARVMQIEGIPDVHASFAELLRATNQADESDTGITLETADAIWLRTGTVLEQEFERIIREHYEAQLDTLDFCQREAAAERINSWVEGKTHDKINDLVKAEMFDCDLTRAALVNAVYFYGSWKYRFNAARTRPGPFYPDTKSSLTVPFMRSESKIKEFMYGETEEYQALELPYGNGSFSMLIVLPWQRFGLKSLEPHVAAGLLAEAVSVLRYEDELRIQMPKFKLTRDYDLIPPLRKLGMIQAFIPNVADFSGMCPTEPWISEVVHKALIDVNEKGTEAAAATAVIDVEGINLHGPKVFQADHPFLFAIREQASGEILFLGRVVNPAP